jgi:hypothetical protein
LVLGAQPVASDARTRNRSTSAHECRRCAVRCEPIDQQLIVAIYLGKDVNRLGTIALLVYLI